MDFNCLRKNFLEVVNISTTLVHINCIPKSKNSSNQLLFGLRLNLSSNEFFSSCQRFSMGFISGDSGGVHHQLMLDRTKKSWAALDVCFGSLSCINRCTWGGGYFSAINGSNVFSKISQYSGAAIIPSNMHTLVAPFLLIAVHMWTLVGCLGRGVRLLAFFSSNACGSQFAP